MKDVITKIERATSRMLVHYPFFSTLVLSVPYKITTDVERAATNGMCHFYNPDFFRQISLPGAMFVRAHEACHDMLKHPLRMGGRNHRIWNYACDYPINYMLKESRFELVDDIAFDEELGKNSAEKNYDILSKRDEEKRQQRKANGQSPGQPGDSLPDLGGTGEDLRLPDLITDPAEVSRISADIDARIARAATNARLMGKMPGGLALLVDKLLNPQVPWQDELREYMTRTIVTDESWSRRNRRFNIYLPSRKSNGMGEVCVIGDTSGSMLDETNKIAAEVRAINEEVKPERVRLVWADDGVASEQLFTEGEELVFAVKGGGGTDMRKPLAHVEQYDPQVVIMVTDGYTPWPSEEPPYPLIVVCTTDAPVPIGHVIRIS